jgi:Bacteriophage related domain of unknown function
MSNQLEITKALFTRLSSLVLNPIHPISWPAKDFTPPASHRWLRVSEFPTVVRAYGVSNSDANEVRGFMQIDVFTELSVGTIPGQTIAETIENHFKRGLKLPLPSGNLWITSAQINSGVNSAPRWMIPITVNYRAFVPN